MNQRLSAFFLILVLAIAFVIFVKHKQHNATHSVVQMAPAVTQEYCSPEFWIDQNKTAKQVILTSGEIQDFNAAILNVPETKMNDLTALSNQFNGKELQKKLSEFKIPDTPCYVDGKQVDSAFFDEIRKQVLAIETQEEMPLQYGFAVNRTYTREIPCKKNVIEDLQVPDWDIFAGTGVLVNEPLVVYFTIPDKSLSYIQINSYFGWVSTQDIAICRDKEEWLSHKNSLDFLVVTGQKVYLEPSQDEAISEKLLTMGTKLPLVLNEKSVDGRLPWHSYVVKFPCRGQDGKFYSKKVCIPTNRDVSVGYLPYTLENLYTQAFKCLGNQYGWGGMLHNQDCSQFVQEVYKTFGFQLPRDTFQQRWIPGSEKIEETLGLKERQRLLDKTTQGSALYMVRHAMIYLGESHGEHFVISSGTDIFDYQEDQDGKEEKCVNHVHRVVINSLERSKWISRLDTIVTVD